MNKQLARQHDQFAAFLSGAFTFRDKLDQNALLESGQTMGISASDTRIILEIMVADRLLTKEILSNKTDEEIRYSPTPELTKMIYDEGGYKKKRSDKSKQEQNINFTLAKNWIWLAGLIFSVLLNLYFIISILIKDS